MDIEDVQIKVQTTCESRCTRAAKVAPTRKRPTSFEQDPPPTEDEIVTEARRCIYCHDAPCSSCCPTNLDVKEYIHAAAARNWYYAAKIILSSNPVPLSTGLLCPVHSLCQGGCNLQKTRAGPILTNEIQVHCIRRFREYNIKQIVPPNCGHKVAVVGSGPAGMSCAAYLRRFGIEVTIFEQESFAGGILQREILPFRVPKEDVDFEVKMLEDINVEFKFNQTLGKDFTVDSLLKDGYECVFLAFGKPDKINVPFPTEGAVTAREFLTELNGILKFKNGKPLPDYKGKKVCVLGSGGTACDCASAALRLGGDVTMACFEDFKSFPAPLAEVEKLLREGVEFMTLVQVKSIVNGEVKFVTVEHREDGKYYELGENITRKYDHVILAFGATLRESKSNIPGEVKIHKVEGFDNVFAGGDITGVTGVVEAANDGKYAARLIANKLGFTQDFPLFHTAVDDVPLETTMCGLKFINPVGISSAEVSGTYECCRNSLIAGMGFCTTKTIILTKDVQRDNDMRIVKCDDNPLPGGSYMNIAMLSEHSCEYWLDAIKKLKAEFPDRIIIASISAMDKKEDWHELVTRVQDAGADLFELNLSCPNEVHGEGGHKGGFNTDNKIGMALGTHPISVKRISEYVKEVAKIPFFVKLTPNITDSTEIAKASIDGGAAGVSMINTVSGIPRFFPDGTPYPQVGTEKFVLSGGLSGDIIRPIALRQISKVHLSTLETPIIGIGGIWSGDTAMQHMYAGANIFEICSATIRYSYEVCHEIFAGLRFVLYSWSRPDLRSLLSHHLSDMKALPHLPAVSKVVEQDRPVPTLLDLRGIGARKVVQRESLPPTWTVEAYIDPETCLNCGKCGYTCRDNGNNAIFKQADGSWKVEGSKCVGCGACISVCPVKALSFKQSDAEKIWHWK
ncbi:Dihydroorotate dehydrogenase family protein [Tritrichomonas foetus]|uniref:dihydropyrimidine dehydrogenase (NADP(+)) n=1 Tax=Tritrichomonas foetus TaxID=1144522 RepID=A0A1J4K4H6_9EUKA|nr:Dihydroorotate dehydrogenase family protein [Tritrichomonas foetus]|eukprot:OHT06287.1 Dihydroorotate dehydrogenase family protein [Tritrichomonas foetus]